MLLRSEFRLELLHADLETRGCRQLLLELGDFVVFIRD